MSYIPLESELYTSYMRYVCYILAIYELYELCGTRTGGYLCVCVRARARVHMYVCMYACMHVFVYCTALYVHTYVWMMDGCMHVCIYVCMYVCMYACMYGAIYTMRARPPLQCDRPWPAQAALGSAACGGRRRGPRMRCRPAPAFHRDI